MAKARLLAPWVGEEKRSATYHVISRVCGRAFLLDDEAKEQFVRYMRLYERFCGVRVLTYCIMTNHFHLLVEVPPRQDEALSDEDLLERLAVLYDEEFVATIREQLAAYASASATEMGRKVHAELRQRFTRRMWDLGLFMKTLKQRFSSWYNKRHDRCGTLWEARYKSVLVESGYAARVMAAYIDLNPLRAGMVTDPKDYRWCGYAEAVAGGKLARNGLLRVLGKLDEDVTADGWRGAIDLKKYDWRSVARRYRLILFEDGVETADEVGTRKRRGFTAEEIEREQERGGALSIPALVACKSRYFVDSVVLGGKAFVNEVVEALKASGGGVVPPTRKTGASPLRGEARSPVLWSMRKLE